MIRSTLTALFWLALVPVVGAALLALAGPLHWLPLLATHFRPHLALAALVLLLLALPLRQRAGALLLLAGLLAAAWPVAVAWNARAAPQEDSDARLLRVASYNIYYGNDRIATLAPEVLAFDADILFLTEVLPRHAPLIQALRAAYPYHALPGAEGGQGDALFSRLPLGEALRRRTTESTSLWIVEATLSSGSLTLLLGHPLPATNGARDLVHATWFAAAQETLVALPAGAPVLVVGDLNATPWSSRLASLLAAGDLRWTGDGLATWPTRLSRWRGLPIDHILIPRAFGLQDWQAVTLPGSDHRAVIATLRLPPS